jgi:5-(carboxyamino)imidazole ribonucleotide synthase
VSAPTPYVLPGATLGVIGGGQLGRMFVHAAQRMGYFTAVLDPDADSPAGRVSHHHIHTDYTDVDGLARLAGLAEAITTEFENVPAPSLENLAVARPVAPAAASVAIAQDRIREKAHFVRCGVACAPYAVIETAERIATRAELAAAWEATGGVPCVLEKRLALDYECSVIVARGQDGQMVHFPPQRNLHRDGILAVTEVYPGNIPAGQASRAVESTRAIADGLGYVGVLCVEYFVLADGTMVVNEMAPRPHNSGHWSMDACDLSQFDLQVRTVAGLPLSTPRQHSPAVMLNLLGDLWFVDASDTTVEPSWADVLALPGVHLHLYGKTDARRGRKMGHLNITGPDIDAVRSTADFAAAVLGLPIPLSE